MQDQKRQNFSGIYPAQFELRSDSPSSDQTVTKVLAKNLKLLTPGTSYALIIRHAERPNFSVLNFRQDTHITEKGLKDSQTLGKVLRELSLTGIYSSPVLRCLQTSNGVMQGASLDHLQITTRERLGEPGSYIVNPLIVFTYFLTADVSAVIRKFISRGRMRGFMPLREGSIRILKEVLGDISRADTRNLYVSHDAVLAPFISFFTGEVFGEEDWIDYLDGVFVAVKAGKVSLIWNGREYPIDADLYT
jgi:hypothetical protein